MAKGKKREAPPKVPKVSPASVAAPPAPIPEELQTVWDDDIAAAFKDLRPQQRTFLLVYIQTGNAAESYRRAYNPNASDHTASSLGAQSMATNGIRSILSKFENQETHDLFLSVHTLREMAQATKPQWQQDRDGQWENAGDVPDWLARKHAIEGLTKLRGLNKPTEVKHSGNVAMTHKYDIPNKRPVGT